MSSAKSLPGRLSKSIRRERPCLSQLSGAARGRHQAGGPAAQGETANANAGPLSHLEGDDELQIISFGKSGRDGIVRRQPHPLDDQQIGARSAAPSPRARSSSSAVTFEEFVAKARRPPGSRTPTAAEASRARSFPTEKLPAGPCEKDGGSQMTRLKAPAPLDESVDGLQGVAGDGFHRRRVEAGQLEVPAGARVDLGRQIHRHHFTCSRARRVHRKGPGIRKQVQHPPVGRPRGDRGAAEAQVGEQPHPEGHFHASKHPVVRSIERGENWGWCYVDDIMYDLSRGVQHAEVIE